MNFTRPFSENDGNSLGIRRACVHHVLGARGSVTRTSGLFENFKIFLRLDLTLFGSYMAGFGSVYFMKMLL